MCTISYANLWYVKGKNMNWIDILEETLKAGPTIRSFFQNTRNTKDTPSPKFNKQLTNRHSSEPANYPLKGNRTKIIEKVGRIRPEQNK